MALLTSNRSYRLLFSASAVSNLGDGISALAFPWLVWMIALPARPQVVRRKVWPEVAEGWAWMHRHPVVLRLAVMLGLINGFSIMSLTVLVLFSQEILSLDAVGHGFLLTAGAAGGVVGGMIGPKVVGRLGKQRGIRCAMLLFPVPFVVICLTSNPYVVAVALFIEMIGALLWNIVTVSYRQRLIPDALLGRVNSIYRFFGWGMMPFGALAAGVLVAATEPAMGREAALRMPFALAAVGMGTMFLYGRAKVRL